MIKRLFDNFKQRRENQRRGDGYRFAAGELLDTFVNAEHRRAVDALNDYVASSRDFGDFDAFDEGIILALNDFEKLLKK